MMKEINKNLYKSVLSTEFMDKLIEKCDDMVIISCFVKEFVNANTSNSYDYGYSSYNYSGSSKKYEIQKVAKFFDDKIKRVDSEKNLDKLFYCEIFSEFCFFKKNKKIENPNIFNKEHLQLVRGKIKMLIANILETIADQMKNIEILNDVICLIHFPFFLKK